MYKDRTLDEDRILAKPLVYLRIYLKINTFLKVSYLFETLFTN